MWISVGIAAAVRRPLAAMHVGDGGVDEPPSPHNWHLRFCREVYNATHTEATLKEIFQ